MTTYFVGGEIDSVVLYSPWGLSESNAGGTGISGFTRGAIRVESSVGQLARGFGCYLINPTTGQRTAATGTIWTHFSGYISNANNTTWTQYQWFTAAGAAAFRCLMAGSNLWQFQYWTGSAWSNMGATASYNGQNGSAVHDFKITLGVSGNFRYILNGVEMINVNLDLSAVPDIGRLDFGSNQNDCYYHQIIIADYSTIGHTVRRRYPTGNGASSAWDGDWTGVDEFGLNDADGISVSAAGAKETFAANTLTATESGKVIKAVALGARCRTDEAAVPRTVKGVIRIGSTDYESPTMAGTDSYVYGGSLAIWDKDPSTGNDWINIANANGEIGLKSDT